VPAARQAPATVVCVTHTSERQPANLVSAFALAAGERIRTATEAALAHGASAPAALVALESFAAGETIDGLRRVLGLTHSGTVRVVDRLVAAGLVERRMGPDARSVALSLTPAGRRTARRVMVAREAAAEEPLAALSPAERARLGDLLARVLVEVVGAPDAARHACRLCDVEACRGAVRACPMTCRDGSLSTEG
jgi:DNA-binding MarR family transcriptional regulator